MSPSPPEGRSAPQPLSLVLSSWETRRLWWLDSSSLWSAPEWSAVVAFRCLSVGFGR